MIYAELFWTFFKIGLFTFGGGYAMIPLIRAEVIQKGWLTGEQVVNFIAVSESTPGPFAINLSTYTGCEMAGIFGGLCATIGVVLPSFVIILIVARIYDKFRKSKPVQACMSGLKPATIGLIGAASISIAKTVFFPDGVSADVFSETDHLLLRERFLLHRLWKRRQKLHPDKNAAADPIFTRHDCKVVAAHDVRLSLQLPHHLIFLHVALQLIRVCRHHALRIIAIVIVCLDLLIIRRA